MISCARAVGSILVFGRMGQKIPYTPIPNYLCYIMISIRGIYGVDLRGGDDVMIINKPQFDTDALERGDAVRVKVGASSAYNALVIFVSPLKIVLRSIDAECKNVDLPVCIDQVTSNQVIIKKLEEV